MTKASYHPPPPAATGDEPAFDGGYLDTLPDGAVPLVLYSAATREPDDAIEVRLIRRRDEPARSEWASAVSLPDLFPRLADENAAGWNIYASVNPRRHGQRGDSAVTMARCCWSDHDGIDPDIASAIAAGMPVPTMVMSSGHGTHVYWRLREPMADLSAWSALQRDIAQHLGSDPAMGNPERIMRLPAFQNMKGEPVPCCIVSVDATRRASWDSIRSIVPRRPQGPAPVRRVVVVNRDDIGDNVKRAAAYIRKMPAGIAGQCGHRMTFAAACECVKFGLTDAEALALLYEFNGRCDPPWSDKEISHKLNDARKKAVAGSRLIGGRR